MHNVLTLFKTDLRHLFCNVVSCIITIGLIVIPSIFAWYNIIACWDVFNNTGNVKVAVANDDEGYKSDLLPLRVNIGDMVVSALRANDQIGWTITSAEDAIDGAASGKYYAAVVIPQTFSRDMLRFYSDDAEHAQITYYSNEKKNAISPKITATGADTVSNEVNTVFAQTLYEVMLSVADALSNYADENGLDERIAALAGHISAMADDMERVQGVVTLHVEALRSSQTLLADGLALLASAEDALQEMSHQVASARDQLGDASASIGDAEQKLSSALDGALASFDELEQLLESPELSALISPEDRERLLRMIADAKESMNKVKDDYETTLKPGLDQLAADITDLGTEVTAALEACARAGEKASGFAGSASGILASAIADVEGASAALGDSSAKLKELASSITEALAAGNDEALKQILGSDAKTLSSALAAPVAIERVAVFPSSNFGSAMAPFYTILAVFIGSLLMLVVIKPKVSNKDQELLDDPKPRQMFFGRFCCMAALSFAQTTLMGLGNIFFLGVQAVHPLLLMACLWIAGIVFTFIIYVLVLSFANLGKALAVCLLIMQVTGCGGSYPLQILPAFVQWVSPLLPATHAVNALRAAMFGMYQGDFWIQIGYLLVFLIPAALIGLAFRKPFEKFMKWYIRKVESTKIIN